MRIPHLAAGTISFLFVQCATAQLQVQQSASASSAPSAPVDAARSGTLNSDDLRSKPGYNRGAGFGLGLSIQIQGDGVALPRGVGGGGPTTPAAEKEREKESDKKQASVVPGCVGPNRDGQACVDKDPDSVARRIDQGLERSPGATRPTDTRLQGTGVATPRCFGDSRDGVDCSK